MKVTDNNKFCRVFELPATFSEKYCFAGGIDTTFKMVDWFNSIVTKEDIIISEYMEDLKQFVKAKNYIKPNRKYLIITDFGEVCMIN